MLYFTILHLHPFVNTAYTFKVFPDHSNIPLSPSVSVSLSLPSLSLPVSLSLFPGVSRATPGHQSPGRGGDLSGAGGTQGQRRQRTRQVHSVDSGVRRGGSAEPVRSRLRVPRRRRKRAALFDPTTAGGKIPPLGDDM